MTRKSKEVTKGLDWVDNYIKNKGDVTTRGSKEEEDCDIGEGQHSVAYGKTNSWKAMWRLTCTQPVLGSRKRYPLEMEAYPGRSLLDTRDDIFGKHSQPKILRKLVRRAMKKFFKRIKSL